MQYHKYSLTELENMLPWERTIYIQLLTDYIKKANERIEMQKQMNKARR